MVSLLADPAQAAPKFGNKVFTPFTVASPMVQTEKCSFLEPKEQLKLTQSGDFDNDQGAITHLSSVLQPMDSLNL